jgi:hypothetical protein
VGDAVNQTENTSNQRTMSRTLHFWRMAFFGLVILLAGMVLGAALTLSLVRHPGEPAPSPEFAAVKMLDGLQHYLDLSDEQTEKLQPILLKHLQQLYDIRLGARSKIAEQLRQMNTEIASILNDHQKRLWHEHLQQLQGQLRERGPGPPRPPRGPYRHRGGDRGGERPPSGLSPNGLWGPPRRLRYLAPTPPSLQGDVLHVPELQKD